MNNNSGSINEQYEKVHHYIAKVTWFTLFTILIIVILLIISGVFIFLELAKLDNLGALDLFNTKISLNYLVALAPIIIISALLIPAVGLIFLVAELTAGIRVLRHREYYTPVHKIVTPKLLVSSKAKLTSLLTSKKELALPGHGAKHIKDLAKKPSVKVLIPAHNEEEKILFAINSLKTQTYSPSEIIVIADNCTDDTINIAKKAGATVYETVNNTNKKAGALNQILDLLLPKSGYNDLLMIMDADGIVSEDFIKTSIDKMLSRPDLTAVGGLFFGDEGCGILGQLQRNEYARYQRQVGRRKGKVFVLSGTASVFRAHALATIAESRGKLIPGVPGEVYDTQSLTEDNEMTIALKSLGGVLLSPRQCRVTTEVMKTWKDLWRQRIRWQRGALENIGTYGLTRATFRYWFQQVGIGYGVIALNSYLILMVITIFLSDNFTPVLFWLLVGLIFVIERTVTVWRAGPKAVLIALPIFIEIAYDLFIQAAFIKSLFDIIFEKKARWYHPSSETHT